MQQINQGLRGRVEEGCGVSDMKAVERIRSEYLRAEGEYWSFNVDDVGEVLSLVDEQQQEIKIRKKQFDDLEKRWSMEGDAREDLLWKNARLREALETIADEGHSYVGEIAKFLYKHS